MKDRIRLSAFFPVDQKQIKKLIELRDSLDMHEYKELRNSLDDILHEFNTKNSVGRPRAIKKEEVQKLKNSGFTQEQISRELNVSLSTVRRCWK